MPTSRWNLRQPFGGGRDAEGKARSTCPFRHTGLENANAIFCCDYSARFIW